MGTSDTGDSDFIFTLDRERRGEEREVSGVKRGSKRKEETRGRMKKKRKKEEEVTS